MGHPRLDNYRKRILATFQERFWKRLNPGKPDECWEWPGTKNTHGYGAVSRLGKMILTHRIAWELTRGPIPEGLNVLHECDNPPCSNPAHLFLGTLKDNTQDCLRKGRYCKMIGSTNGLSKLNDEKVLKIRELSKTLSREELAAIFRVNVRNIDFIVERVTWRHI